ncbi:hypothetical protein BV898_12321 [Hypsibius exemplaris]|uniref:Integrator complex subunit 14 n=1 Tax=Hypsibius exemplaris TaxID=2072580 RepID=A0A1W0WE49_HYPEX|nr:hypothetical protein BV898_12321 [Hypsibius exemplaris]
MSTIIVIEWSLPMCQPVLTWDPTSGKQIECITPSSRSLTASVANLSLIPPHPRPATPPTCLDFAMTAVKYLAGKASASPAIVNGGLHSEPVTFATFDHAGLQHISATYEEFRDKLFAAATAAPPTRSSYLAMLQGVQSVLGSVKTPANVVVFASTLATAATQEVAMTAPVVRSQLLPLLSDSALFLVPVGRGTVDDNGSLDFFRGLIAMNAGHGELCWETQRNEGDDDSAYRFDLSRLEVATNKLSQLMYRTFTATLSFGELSGRFQLIPSPNTVRGGRKSLSEECKILGVVDKLTVDKQFTTRQYLILPSSNAVTPIDGVDTLQEPHFVPLLHASLRQMAGKVLLVHVGKAQYGYIEPTEDAKTKKKSGLVLNLFPEGMSFDLNKPIMAEEVDGGAAVAMAEEALPSYDAGNTGYTMVWTCTEAVQGDAARLQRMAKRLPDKKDLFFRELNKIRLHALSTCNVDFMLNLVAILAREVEYMKDSHGIQELESVLQQLRYPHPNLTAPLKSLDGTVYSLES